MASTAKANRIEQAEYLREVTYDPKYTDVGNAERLLDRHGDQLRFVPGWDWLIWDGRRWRRDETGQVMELAKETASALREAAAAVASRDRAHADELWQHAHRSEAKPRLQAMVDLARSDPRVVRSVEQFDADPWLLTCLNGTLDLRTGELREHRKDDHITKLAPVSYTPDATSSDWVRFLQEVFQDDEDLIAFMRRAVGYSLTGSIREPAFFIPFGAGRNGKSTLFRALMRVMGDYAQDTPVETFLRKQFSGAVNNDQAALAGARFITASEPEANQTLNISLVKRITGGDPITARYLNKEYFTYKPQGKVWMATNHKPSIPENTTAIWARIKLIPFLANFYGREDNSVDARLESASEAILAWAVQGCVEWQRNGLNDPEPVRNATLAYRAEQDEWADFFEECCVFGPTQSVKSSELYAKYKEWAHENSMSAVSTKQFAPLITSLPGRDIVKVKLHGVMTFKGIGLASRADGPQASTSYTASSRMHYTPTDDLADDDLPY